MKKPSFLTGELMEKKTISDKETKKQEPELDRFGLPVLTSENIFPPLPTETKLVPVQSNQTPSREDLKSILQDYLPLDLETVFDEEGNGIIPNGDGSRWKLNLLHEDPPVLEIENFFTEEECQTCMDLALKSTENEETGLMEVQSATFNAALAQSKRTSTTWFCHYSQVPTLLAKAQRLCLNLPLENLEEPQVVRYRNGEEFSWHYDEVPAAQLDNGGQRVATLLVYLNTLKEDEGGGTMFRDLKDSPSPGNNMVTMRPQTGSALLFFPATADGRPDDRTLHKGEVIAMDASSPKMIAQMWIHQSPYAPVVPPGNTHTAARQLVETEKEHLGYP
eukprot:scaffold10016_cov54-Attheya_sp.AAC.4